MNGFVCNEYKGCMTFIAAEQYWIKVCAELWNINFYYVHRFPLTHSGTDRGSGRAPGRNIHDLVVGIVQTKWVH